MTERHHANNVIHEIRVAFLKKNARRNQQKNNDHVFAEFPRRNASLDVTFNIEFSPLIFCGYFSLKIRELLVKLLHFVHFMFPFRVDGGARLPLFKPSSPVNPRLPRFLLFVFGQTLNLLVHLCLRLLEGANGVFRLIFFSRLSAQHLGEAVSNCLMRVLR